MLILAIEIAAGIYAAMHSNMVDDIDQKQKKFYKN
jgi:hypothetical protein